jgi:hypothetical protein
LSEADRFNMDQGKEVGQIALDDYAMAVRSIWVPELGHTLGDERQSGNHVHLVY